MTEEFEAALIGRLDGLIEAVDELVAAQLLAIHPPSDKHTPFGLAMHVRELVDAMNQARAQSKTAAE